LTIIRRVSVGTVGACFARPAGGETPPLRGRTGAVWEVWRATKGRPYGYDGGVSGRREERHAGRCLRTGCRPSLSLRACETRVAISWWRVRLSGCLRRSQCLPGDRHSAARLAMTRFFGGTWGIGRKCRDTRPRVSVGTRSLRTPREGCPYEGGRRRFGNSGGRSMIAPTMRMEFGGAPRAPPPKT